MSLQFIIDSMDGDTLARTGTLTLAHGEVETPAFMPVGTNGRLKLYHMKHWKKSDFL